MTPQTDVSIELLGPVMSKGEARSLELQARRHYKGAVRNLSQLCADLRRLQDGGAHFARGFDSFGAYVEHTFHGLSAASAKQLSRQGQVLLALEEHDKISLQGHARDLPGTTGLRALASVLNQHGEAVMLDVYDRAKALRPDRALVAETVAQVMRQLLAATVPERRAVEAPAPPGDDGLDIDADDVSAADEDEEPEEVHELRDRLILVRGVLDDLSLAVSGLRTGDGAAAGRAMRELAEEIPELQAPFDAAQAAADNARGVM